MIGFDGGFPVTDSFWDTQTSEQRTSSGGTGLTTAKMQDINTFLSAGWDFVDQADGPNDVWASLPGEPAYMILWWQLSVLPTLPGFSGETGDHDDPYLISTAAELNQIGHNLRLMNLIHQFHL